MSARGWIGAALLGAVTLAGCGSGTESADRVAVLRQLAQGLAEQRGGGAVGGGVGPAQIRAALEGTEEPLLLARFSQTGNSAIMIGVEQTGPYTTFATGERQTITLRDGFLISTRGLGGDLMSSDIDAVAALITERRGGEAQRVMRFLNAADTTYEVTFDCRVTPGATQRIAVGTSETTATQVTETCVGRRGREITNTYMIDDQGRAVASSQWAGDLIRMTDFGVLRF